MSKIASPADFAAHTPVRDRLFFGFQPGDAALSAIVSTGRDVHQAERIADPLRVGVVHLTLGVVLDAHRLTDDQIERYVAVGDRLGERGLEPVRLVLTRASRFQRNEGRAPLVLVPNVGRRAFKEMQRALLDTLAELGLPPPPYRLSDPHVTLSYGYGNVDRPIPPIVWDICELVLIHSLVGLTQHQPIKTWPLKRGLDLFD